MKTSNFMKIQIWQKGNYVSRERTTRIRTKQAKIGKRQIRSGKNTYSEVG